MCCECCWTKQNLFTAQLRFNSLLIINKKRPLKFSERISSSFKAKNDEIT